MTNKEKIEHFKQIYADFVVGLNKLKSEAIGRRKKKSEANNKAEIEDILSKIKSNF